MRLYTPNLLPNLLIEAVNFHLKKFTDTRTVNTTHGVRCAYMASNHVKPFYSLIFNAAVRRNPKVLKISQYFQMLIYFNFNLSDHRSLL